MKTINLLEPKPFQFTYRRMLGLIGICVIAAAVHFGFMHWRNARTDANLKKLTQEVAVLKGQQKKLESVLGEEDEEGALQGIAALRAQFATRSLWTPFLREIVDKIPTDISLTGLEGTHSAGNQNASLIVSGTTPDTGGVTTFIRRLSDGVYVKQPSHSETHLKNVPGKTSFDFTIDYKDVQL